MNTFSLMNSLHMRQTGRSCYPGTTSIFIIEDKRIEIENGKTYESSDERIKLLKKHGYINERGNNKWERY